MGEDAARRLARHRASHAHSYDHFEFEEDDRFSQVYSGEFTPNEVPSNASPLVHRGEQGDDVNTLGRHNILSPSTGFEMCFACEWSWSTLAMGDFECRQVRCSASKVILTCELFSLQIWATLVSIVDSCRQLLI